MVSPSPPAVVQCHVCASAGRRPVDDSIAHCTRRWLHVTPQVRGRHDDGRGLAHTSSEGACAFRGGARRTSETHPRSGTEGGGPAGCMVCGGLRLISLGAGSHRTDKGPSSAEIPVPNAACARMGCEGAPRIGSGRGGGTHRRVPWCSFAGSAAWPSFIFAKRSARGGDDWTDGGACAGRKRSVCALTDLPKLAPFIIASRSL